MENKDKKTIAVDLFREGYNCAQAVSMAFYEECGISRDMARNMVSAFGGGLGRQREVCGAVSGMCFVLGAISPFADEDKHHARAVVYGATQELCAEFKARHGSIVCRDILKPGASTNPEPAERTKEYYATRPCEKCVEDAAELIDTYMKRQK